MTTTFARRPIEPRRLVRNGRIPDARFAASLAIDTNALARVRLKELARFVTPLENILESVAGTRVRWRFAAHLSPHTTAIAVHYLLASVTATPSTSSYAELTLDDGTNSLGYARGSYAGPGGGNLPGTFAQLKCLLLTAPATPAQLAGDQAVYGTISEIESARIVGVTVYEIVMNAPDPVDENYALGTPIVDADRAAFTSELRDAWKQQAAPLLTWSADSAAEARVMTSTTATNVIDLTSTTVASSTPGWTFDLRNASTLRRVTVPCVMKAYASAAVDAGTVLLVDSTGATVATITIPVGAAAWQSTTFNLPAAVDKYDLQFKAGTGGTTTLEAVSIYPHET